MTLKRYANNDGTAYQTIANLRIAAPNSGSSLCSFSNTAKNNCGTKISAVTTPDKIENSAFDAIAALSALSGAGNTQLKLNLNDLRAMAYLSHFDANKYRAAMFLEQGKGSEAIKAMGNTYCNGMQYTEIMNSMYIGPGALQRVSGLLKISDTENCMLLGKLSILKYFNEST